MLRFDAIEVQPQRLNQNIGKNSCSIVLTLTIADNDLPVGEVQILNTQTQDFHQAQAATIHDLGHEAINALNPVDHLQSFGL